jgi:hypothetical protein
MKYKKGDKVKIKTWEQMEKEYGLSQKGTFIDCDHGFLRGREKALNTYCPGRIVTIKGAYEHFYKIEDMGSPSDEYTRWTTWWSDDMIEGSVKELKNRKRELEKRKKRPLPNRFELMIFED